MSAVFDYAQHTRAAFQLHHKLLEALIENRVEDAAQLTLDLIFEYRCVRVWCLDKMGQEGSFPRQVNHTKALVRQFHEAFGHPINADPVIPDEATRRLRVQLIAEELREFAEASGFKLTTELLPGDKAPDLVEAADALGDLDYVVQGSNLAWGMPSEAIIEEIHTSNMTKLLPDGRVDRTPEGKILKGPQYRPPNLPKVLAANCS